MAAVVGRTGRIEHWERHIDIGSEWSNEGERTRYIIYSLWIVYGIFICRKKQTKICLNVVNIGF